MKQGEGGETIKGNKDRMKKKITITYLHTLLDSKNYEQSKSNCDFKTYKEKST